MRGTSLQVSEDHHHKGSCVPCPSGLPKVTAGGYSDSHPSALYLPQTAHVGKENGFPGGASGKEPACQCRGRKRPGLDYWVGKVPWRRKWQPAPVLAWRIPWRGEPGGLRSTASQSRT